MPRRLPPVAVLLALLLAPLPVACGDSSSTRPSMGRSPSAEQTESNTDENRRTVLHVNTIGEEGDFFAADLDDFVPQDGPPAEPAELGANVRLSVRIYVARSGTVSDPQTELFYRIERCGTLGCQTLYYGSGEIPNRDLKGDGRNWLLLNTNTSEAANPGFHQFGLPGGPIMVEWRSHGDGPFGHERLTGVSEMQFGSYLQRSNGTMSYTGARVRGTIFGITLPEAGQYSYMGMSHAAVTIQITQ